MSQLLSVDFAIVAVYLVFTLVVGIRAGKGITTMKQYAIGDRKRYGTAVLVATLAATVIGGASTIGLVEKIVNFGIIWMFVFLGFAVEKLLVAKFIAPHVGKFRGMISVGDMMESFFGQPAKFVSGISGFLYGLSRVAVQVGSISYVCQYFFGVTPLVGSIIGAEIAVVYSCFGGAKAVTYTDVFQFCTIIVIIPMIAFMGIYFLGGTDAFIAKVPKDKAYFSLNFTEHSEHINTFFLFCVPFLAPHTIQRLLMARDARQAVDTFKSVAFICVPFFLFVGCIGLLAICLSPNVQANQAFFYTIDVVLPPVFRGIAIAGFLAIVMSTSDSWLNATSICLAHDVVKPLCKSLSDQTELRLARLLTFLLGNLAIFVVLYLNNIYSIFIVSYMFWIPIILAPFILGVLGFHASSRSFFFAAASGLATALAWKIGLVQGTGLLKLPLIPSIIANGCVLLVARRFDTPKARGEQANGGGRTGTAGPSSHIFSFKPLLDSLPTPHRYIQGCSWRARLFQIPYPSFAGTTIGCILLASIVSLKPEIPHFHLLMSLRFMAAVLCVLVLLRQYLPVSLLHKHLPAYWFAQNTFVWPCINTFAWLNKGGDLPSLGFWTVGFVFFSLVLDLRSTIYMSVVGSVLGWVLHVALGGSHTVPACLLAIPLEAWCLGMPLAVGAVLFPRSREAFAWGQATALRMRCIMANHDLGDPLSALQQQAIQLNKHLDELIRAHQVVCQTDKSFTSLSKEQYTGLRAFGKHFQESIRKAIDFAEAMLGNIKDPMQFTAKTGIV
ncbi:MAG: sodium:solute symporter family protein, partial [Myxococcota bacterium]